MGISTRQAKQPLTPSKEPGHTHLKTSAGQPEGELLQCHPGWKKTATCPGQRWRLTLPRDPRFSAGPVSLPSPHSGLKSHFLGHSAQQREGTWSPCSSLWGGWSGLHMAAEKNQPTSANSRGQGQSDTTGGILTNGSLEWTIVLNSLGLHSWWLFPPYLAPLFQQPLFLLQVQVCISFVTDLQLVLQSHVKLLLAPDSGVCIITQLTAWELGLC